MVLRFLLYLTLSLLTFVTCADKSLLLFQLCSIHDTMLLILKSLFCQGSTRSTTNITTQGDVQHKYFFFVEPHFNIMLSRKSVEKCGTISLTLPSSIPSFGQWNMFKAVYNYKLKMEKKPV